MKPVQVQFKLTFRFRLKIPWTELKLCISIINRKIIEKQMEAISVDWLLGPLNSEGQSTDFYLYCNLLQGHACARQIKFHQNYLYPPPWSINKTRLVPSLIVHEAVYATCIKAYVCPQAGIMCLWSTHHQRGQRPCSAFIWEDAFLAQDWLCGRKFTDTPITVDDLPRDIDLWGQSAL